MRLRLETGGQQALADRHQRSTPASRFCCPSRPRKLLLPRHVQATATQPPRPYGNTLLLPLPSPAGLRPACASAFRPVRAARIVATAAPIHSPAHTNGAASEPAVPQTVIISEPVTVSGPVQIAGVLPPAAIYQAVSVYSSPALFLVQSAVSSAVLTVESFRGLKARSSQIQGQRS